LAASRRGNDTSGPFPPWTDHRGRPDGAVRGRGHHNEIRPRTLMVRRGDYVHECTLPGGNAGSGPMNTFDLELLDVPDEGIAAAALARFVRREHRLPDHHELVGVLSPATEPGAPD